MDDVLVIWSQKRYTFTWEKFLSAIHRIPNIKWTVNQIIQNGETPFLDINIIKSDDYIYTKSFEKSLNLYLYTIKKSAHPPGIFKGIIIGLIKKLYTLNSNFKDFKYFVNLLYIRLRKRGYSPFFLDKIFKDTWLQLNEKFNSSFSTTSQSPTSLVNKKRPLVFKIRYDPSGPPNKLIRNLICAEDLEDILSTRVVIAYKRPRNLKDILFKNNFTSNDTF